MRDNKKTACRPPGTAGRNAAKKPLRGGNLEAVTSRACAENLNIIIISHFWQNASPIRTGKEVFPVTGWEVVLTMIGTGWLTGRLFRLIDMIER